MHIHNITLVFSQKETGWGGTGHSSVLFPALFNTDESTTDIRKLNEKRRKIMHNELADL